MKSIITALVALSIVTGVAASAQAFDAKSFYAAAGQSRSLTLNDAYNRKSPLGRPRGVFLY